MERLPETEKWSHGYALALALPATFVTQNVFSDILDTCFFVCRSDFEPGFDSGRLFILSLILPALWMEPQSDA